MPTPALASIVAGSLATTLLAAVSTAAGQAGDGATARTHPTSQGVTASSRAAANSSGSDRTSESSSTTSVVDGDLRVVITTTSKTSLDREGNENVDERTETRVTLGGAEVPPERLRMTEGRLDILNESGEVIRSVQLPSARAAASAGGGSGQSSGSTSSRGVRSRSQSGGPSPIPTIQMSPGGAVRSSAGGGPPLVVRGQVLPDGTARPKVMLGVTLDGADESLARHLNLNPEEVTVFSAVTPDTPAARAGLQQWDVVVSVDGKKPSPPAVMREVLRSKEPGQTMQLTVVRAGGPREFSVTLDAFDATKLGQPMVWTLDASPIGHLNFEMDEKMRSMLEEMRDQVQNLDIKVDWETMFAPATPGTPLPPGGASSGSGASSMYRFFVPGTERDPAGSQDRMRELELRIEALNATIRRLEERLGTAGRLAPAAPPAPAKSSPPAPARPSV